MIDTISIDHEGPDGTWLVVDDDETMGPVRFRLTDDACGQLDSALVPWREHQAEGARVGAEYARHVKAGRCGSWVSGEGPCMRERDHDGEHRCP